MEVHGALIYHTAKNHLILKKGIANTLSDQDRIWKIEEAYNNFLQGLKSVNMTEATVKSQNMQSA